MQIINDIWLEQRKQKSPHKIAVVLEPHEAAVYTVHGGRREAALPNGEKYMSDWMPLKAHMQEWLNQHAGEGSQYWRFSPAFKFISFANKEMAAKFIKWWYIPPEDYAPRRER